MLKFDNYCGSGPLYWWIWPFVLDTTSVLVGGAPSGGLFFAKKSVLEMRTRYFLNFNKKCQILIIHVDLALCTGYNNINNN